jgi:hypothetical protein
MTISYTNPKLKNILYQPLYRRFNQAYRSPRSSVDENLANQKMYLDIKRIHLQLEQINDLIFDRAQAIVNAEKDSSHPVDSESDSRFYGSDYYDLTEDGIIFSNPTEIQSALYSINAVSSKVSNLFFKINQIERQDK